MERRYLIGMTGGSGSGKTTILKELSENFNQDQLSIVCLDEYYKPRDEQVKDEKGIRNFDLPTSLDSNALAMDIKALLNGETIHKEEYTFNNLEKEPEIKIFRPAKVILCEGLFVLHYKEIREMLDYKVYIHTRESIQLIRRIKRDKIERNYPLDDVLYRYENHVLPSYDAFIFPYMDQSDLVIDTLQNRRDGIALLNAKVRDLLKNLV